MPGFSGIGRQLTQIQKKIVRMAIRFRSNSDTYREFSNFAPYPIEMDGETWPSVEHYYQAQKFLDPSFRRTIQTAPHGMAAKNRSKSKTQPRREDWAAVKDGIMYAAVRRKFETHDDLRALLLETGEEELIEDVPGDSYWGIGLDGEGQNKLGKILERIRTELRAAQSITASKVRTDDGE